MAKVFIEETTLTAIGDAIRGKEGTTDLVPVTAMATRIADLPEGGGGGNEPTDEELVVTGDCSYRFAYAGWDWVIDRYGDKMSTKDITNCKSMFLSTKVSKIPFDINVANVDVLSDVLTSSKITECPKIRGTIKWNTSTKINNLLNAASMLRDAEDLFTPEMLDGFSAQKVTSTYGSPNVNGILADMYSLRRVPTWWYKFKLNPESTAMPSGTYSIYNTMVRYCYTLDEITDIPVWTCSGAQTSNMFSYSFDSNYRLSRLTFETNPDGTPILANWKSQIINVASVGSIQFNGHRQYILDYNSGITADKEVYDDATYAALKNDPDWYGMGTAYSRYNKTSAVETINSLPDTSAYLATAGGSNTIKFHGNSGSATDGGAINTMTEEEIAVATAKGWTVTLS